MPDRKPCVRCGEKGWYRYDELHSKPCEACCDHRDGVWVLGPYHRDPGHYCCLSGCGKTWPTEADYLADLTNEPTMIWTETAKDILIEAERGYDVSVWSPWKDDLEELHHELCVQLWTAGVEFNATLSTLRVADPEWGRIRLVSGREGLRGVHTDVLYTADLTSWNARITVMESRAPHALRRLPIRTTEGDLE